MALAPLTPDAYLNHLGRACHAFAACLETGDLDAPVPACHGWTLTDLAHHLGTTDPLDPALALDGVDEVVTVMFPRQVRLGRTARPSAALGLTATEGGDWVLAGDGEPEPAATVSGPAEALFLLLWHRIDLGDPRLTVAGSRATAAAVLAAALTP